MYISILHNHIVYVFYLNPILCFMYLDTFFLTKFIFITIMLKLKPKKV